MTIGCEKCFGTGALDAGTDKYGVPLTKPCICQIVRDRIANVNRAWRGMSSAAKVESSPLGDHTEKNLYITASDDSLRSHLRYLGLRTHAQWYFKVIADSDMMTAWLSPVALLGKEILDPEAASVSSEKATLVDLVDPPELLVVRLGVKSARNAAMPEVLLEALNHRAHVQKPTWVVDQPSRRFNPSHISFSDEVLYHISGWTHVTLDEVRPGLDLEMIGGSGPDQTASMTPSTEAPVMGGGLSLSGMYGSPGATRSNTTRLEKPVVEPKKRKTFKGRDE